MKIIFVSDTHLTPRTAAFNRNWNRVADWIRGQGPDFVVHLGDITADGFEHPEELALARQAFDELGCPVSYVPGNHDIGDNPMGPGATPRHPLDLQRLAQYEALFGPDRWTLDREGWRLMGLNAELLGTGTAREAQQFEWVGEQLRGYRGRLGVLLHKPLFRNGPADTEVHVRYVPMAPRRRLLGLLDGCDLRFVASGHAHQTRRFVVDGVEHAWAPSTAFLLPDSIQERIGEKVLGLLTLELTATGHQFGLSTPALEPNSLLDFAEIYPEVSQYAVRISDPAVDERGHRSVP